MQTPRQSSGGGREEKKGRKSTPKTGEGTWWVLRQVGSQEPEPILNTNSKTSAIHRYRRLYDDRLKDVRIGIVQAHDRKTALDLWTMHREADLEEQTRPAPSIPQPGTESGRTHAEELPQLGPPNQSREREREYEADFKPWIEGKDEHQEDDDETTT